MNVTLQTWLVPLLLWVAALAFAGFAIAREPGPIRRDFVVDRLLRYLFLLSLGVMSSRRRPSVGPRAHSNTRSVSPISAWVWLAFTRLSLASRRASPFLSSP